MKNHTFKNNNSKSKTPKFHQIEIRNNREVKNFRKTEILDSEKKSKLDLLLERVVNLTLNLQREVAELKEDMLVNASHITSLRKEICIIRENLIDNTLKTQSLTKAIQDTNEATGDFVDELENLINGLENKIQFLFKQSQSQAQDIEKIKSCMEVFSSHIGVLEKKSEKWTDKFKFGRKPKSIAEEQVFKQHIMELNNSKVHFALNDD